MAYVQEHWAQILLVIVTVDQVLVGLFPKIPVFNQILAFLKNLQPK